MRRPRRSSAPIGVVITNRDRTETLRGCLASLAAQSRPPSWVVIADLGSSRPHAARLRRLARSFRVSYLGFDHRGPWIKGLAFNSAVRRMPSVPFILQLDADVILHPHLLGLTESALERVDAIAYVASYAQVTPKGYDGRLGTYVRLLAGSLFATPWAFGGSFVLPRDWLLSRRGMDESYVGWGFADSDLWSRATRELRTYREMSGSFAVHQPHVRQLNASNFDGNPNWSRFHSDRVQPARSVNPNGVGAAPLRRRAKLRGGIRSRSSGSPEPCVARSVVRAMRGGRLAYWVPAQVSPETGPAEGPFRVSAVLVPSGAGPAERLAAENALSAQTLAPDEVLIARDGLAAALRATRAESSHVLLAGDDLLLGPGSLHALRRFALGPGRAVHGYRHEIPFLASDLELLERAPWEAWGATAFLLGMEGEHWLLARRERLRRAAGGSIPELCAELARDPGVDLVRLGPTFVLGFRYPRRPAHAPLRPPVLSA